jgi:hypothetical protein
MKSKKHTYELTLPVKLTEEQVAERARKMAELHRDVARKYEEKATTAARLKTEIEIMEAQIDDYAGQVRERSEMCRVECERKLDVRDVVEIRLDTGDEVSRRRATPEESQGELALSGSTVGDLP